MTVTGHAASSVCRVASAALFGLARHSDINSPAFFLGAGVGVIDTSRTEEQLTLDIKAFESKHAGLATALNKVAESYLNEQNEQFEFVEMLAKFSGDSEHLAKFNILKAEVAGNINRKTLSNLNTAISGDWTVGMGVSHSEITQRQKLLGDLLPKKASDLSSEEMMVLRRLLVQPVATVAAFWQRENESMDECLKVYRKMPKAVRNNVAREVGELVARIRALETVSSDLTDLADATGLLKFNNDASTLSQPDQLAVVCNAVSTWSKQAKDAEAMDLNALAKGQRGTLLLPYYDLGGQAVSFRLPSDLFMTGEGKTMSDLMRAMTAAEMEGIAKAAAQRLRDVYDEQIDRLEDYKKVAAYLSNPSQKKAEDISLDWSAWLRKVELVWVTLIDHRGQPGNPKQVEKTNFEVLCDAWKTAAEMRQLEAFYLQLAKNASEAESDVVFKEISDRCLIDSLLRGWSLSFSDEETKERFDAWSTECRIRAWESIWQQAMQRGISPSMFFNEGTVFQVCEEQGSFVVQPVYVANILATRCVRDMDAGMIRYDSPWLMRTSAMYSGIDVNLEIKTPEKLADSTVNAVLSDLRKRTDAIDPEEMLQNFKDCWERLPIEQWKADLQLAFCAAPEEAAARSVEAVLDLWPAPSKNVLDKRIQEQWRKLAEYDAMEDDPNKRWTKISSSLQNGSWPFVDQYAFFTLVLREEATSRENEDEQRMIEELAATLEEQGRKLDDAFMSEIIRNNMITRLSAGIIKTRSAFASWSNERSALDACHAIVLLGEASGLLEGYQSADGILHRMNLLERDLAKYEDRTFRDFRAKVEVVADDEDATLSVVCALSDDFKRAANRIESKLYFDGDNSLRHLVARRRLLAEQAGRASKASKVKHSKDVVLNAIKDAEEVLVNDSGRAEWFNEPAKTALDELERVKKKIKTGYFDLLARHQLQAELRDILSSVAKVTVDHLQMTQRETPNRSSLEFLVQLNWGMGRYKDALKLLEEETLAHLATEMGEVAGKVQFLQGAVLINLLSKVQENILKACVYSGGDFFGTSIFGKRQSDWVAKPKKVEDVVISIKAHLPGFIDGETVKQFAALRESAIAGDRSDVSPENPLIVGEYRIVGLHIQPHGECECLVEGPCGRGRLRILPNDKDGFNRARALAGTELAGKLAMENAESPSHLLLSAGENPLVYSDERIVMTLAREIESASSRNVMTAHLDADLPDQLYLSNGRWIDTKEIGLAISDMPEGSVLALPEDAGDLCARFRQHPEAKKRNQRFYLTQKASRGAENMRQLNDAIFSARDTEFLDESEMADLIIEQDDSVIFFVRMGRDAEKARTDFDRKLERAMADNRFTGKRVALVACDNEKKIGLAQFQQKFWLKSVSERVLQSGATLFCSPSQFISDEAGNVLIEASRNVLKSKTPFHDLSEALNEAVHRVRAQHPDAAQPDALPKDFRMDPLTYSYPPTDRDLENLETEPLEMVA